MIWLTVQKSAIAFVPAPSGELIPGVAVSLFWGGLFMKLYTGLVLASLFAAQAHASTIAVVDSGVDLKHQDLAAHVWTNISEIADNSIDDDGNGYRDDVFGWNFAESNNKVIDYKYLNTFSPNPVRFFEIQKKNLEGTVSPEDLAWAKRMAQDPAFIKEVSKFGNFVHGTHVAGIATFESARSTVMALKLIPTESPLSNSENGSPFPAGIATMADTIRDTLIKTLLNKLAEAQGTTFLTVSEYLNAKQADVANYSLGTSTDAATRLMGSLLRIAYGRPATEEEKLTYAKYLVSQMVLQGKQFVDASQKTLFVFAAGNDGKNNDERPVAPANVKATNTLSVAATIGLSKLAPFSNFGALTVDVAAPGVGIESAMPGTGRVYLSGTSQAAPYVANVAAEVKDLNADLTPGEIKRVIMGTVDKKDWLAGKVTSGGMVNPARAKRAADLSLSLPLAKAISQAQTDVPDVQGAGPNDGPSSEIISEADIFVLPLQSELKF